MNRIVVAAGVSTIAGGKWGRGGDHVDGPSEDAKFSSDFDVVYLGSSCSLLVVDRGNQAIREIQLNLEDCGYHYDNSFSLGKLNRHNFKTYKFDFIFTESPNL